jgi:hypothetical protein
MILIHVALNWIFRAWGSCCIQEVAENLGLEPTDRGADPCCTEINVQNVGRFRNRNLQSGRSDEAFPR